MQLTQLIDRVMRRTAAPPKHHDNASQVTETIDALRERRMREKHEIPADEIEHLVHRFKQSEALFEPSKYIEALHNLGLHVDPDPWSEDVAREIVAALSTKRPWSGIRLGDAEAELLAVFDDPKLRQLSMWIARNRFAKLSIHFDASEEWILALKYLNDHAIDSADFVGTLGLWPEPKNPAQTVAFQVAQIRKKAYLGVTGHLFGRAYTLDCGRIGRLREKRIVSAHFYLAVVRHMNEILAKATKVLIINDQPALQEALHARAPRTEIAQITVRQRGNPSKSPSSMLELQHRLPDDLSGCLVLVGMGLWSNPYCAWVKQRGGVAVDIGSGSDLLQGKVTRPIHRSLDLRMLNLPDLPKVESDR